MNAAVTRTRLLQLTLAATGALLVNPRAALASLRAPTLARLSVRNVGRRYAGDRRLFASVSPGVQGRDRASIRFMLDRPATVRLEAVRTALRRRTTVWTTEQQLEAGAQRIWWKPDPKLPVGTYVMRLTVEDADGNARTYGGRRPATPARSTSPVVRVLGIEAAFDKRSYAPLEPAQLAVHADAERAHARVSRLRHRVGVHGPHRRDARTSDGPSRLVRLERTSGRRRTRSPSRRASGRAASTPPS